MIIKKRCTKCLLPADYPGISFDSRGVCSYCLGTEHFGISRDKRVRDMIRQKDELIKDFERKLEENKGKGEYDCLVLLSGGKDSCYLAYLLKERYNAKILTYTVDNGLFGRIAKANIKDTATTLNVDHIFVVPEAEFFKRLYVHLLLSARKRGFEGGGYIETVCSACSKVILGSGLKEAAKREIPLVVSGHVPEQIGKYFYEIPCDEINRSWVPDYVNSKPFTEEDKQYFWNPGGDTERKSVPEVLFPLHAMEHANPAQVTREVVSLGLVKRKNVSPRVTNCHLNWLLQYLDRKRGHEPLVATMSYRIRTGMGDRRKALIVSELSNIFVKSGIYRHCIRRREINHALKFLERKVEDLM